jgi:hypothetical protein
MRAQPSLFEHFDGVCHNTLSWLISFALDRPNQRIGKSPMASSAFPLVGVELYFEDLPRARAFYQEVLGLELAETQEGHHAKFMTPGGFICLERQGVEEYPSADKAVLFFEVTNLSQANKA